MSKLALGTAQFGLNYGIANKSGIITVNEVKKILCEARRFGVTTIDTAISYGSSEQALGQANVESLSVITKLPSIPADCFEIKEWVKNQIQGSLSRLRVNNIYGLLLHNPAQLEQPIGQELISALKDIQAQGLVKKIGVSLYSFEQVEDILKKFKFDLIQAPLNLVDRRLIESGLAFKLKEMGVEIHARSIFLQGLLLMRPNERPDKFGIWTDIWSKWDSWLFNSQLSPIEACLRYALSQDLIDRVIVGIDNLAQFRQINSVQSNSLLNLPSFEKNIDDRLINPNKWNEL